MLINRWTRLAAVPDSDCAHCAHNSLSVHQREVLRLVAEGSSSKAIGQVHLVFPGTVNQHLTPIFNKLGVNTRLRAVTVGAQSGLLSYEAARLCITYAIAT